MTAHDDELLSLLRAQDKRLTAMQRALLELRTAVDDLRRAHRTPALDQVQQLHNKFTHLYVDEATSEDDVAHTTLGHRQLL